MRACFKLAALPTLLSVWWSSQGVGGIDWKIAWPWVVGMIAGTWATWWAVMFWMFPNLKLGSKAGVIAKMQEDLTESNPDER